MVAVGQVFVRHRAHAAGAFGHVLAGHLEMHAAGDGTLGVVDGKELLHLPQHAVEGPGLVARGRLDRVAVHRVADPEHVGALFLHRLDQARQMLANLACAEARDQRQLAGLVLGVELFHQHLEVLGGGGGTAFQTDRVQDAAGELHMRVRSPIQIM